MKVAIVSPLSKKRISKEVKRFGFEISKKPDFVVCYGGDGTILHAERIFPGIPKLVIKKSSSVCKKCEYSINLLKKVLEKISKGNFKVIEEMKLEARVKNQKLLALNEIQVHNKNPVRAIKFSLYTKGKKFENLMGDGVIVSTPYGSTAYYSSTGGKPFKKGIGISFNNLHRKKIKSFVIPENSSVKIKILRGPALVLADNYEKFIEVDKGSKITVKKSEERAKFVKVNFK
jgi:NAD kinase